VVVFAPAPQVMATVVMMVRCIGQKVKHGGQTKV
jgi:hypothetical protein